MQVRGVIVEDVHVVQVRACELIRGHCCERVPAPPASLRKPLSQNSGSSRYGVPVTRIGIFVVELPMCTPT